MRRISGGVTAARGFRAAGLAAGIKRQGPDLALIVSDYPALAAGLTTTHRMAAAPIQLVRESLKAGKGRAILANSGNANCCTGPQGLADARRIRHRAAQLLGVSDLEVLVASTGVIGRLLPTRRILAALPALVRRVSRRGGGQAARAILTTDLVTKSIALSFRIQGRTVRLGGIAKGSGMIDPAMATMLCFLTTDARIRPPALRRALKEAVAQSFNAITVDGQMSTNDSVLILANGAAGHRPLKPGQAGWNTFTRALNEVTQALARAIVLDGEGASRYLTVRVAQAKSRQEALQAAKALANAPLIKTMVRGEDPNWGRLAATLGATRIPFDPRRITLQLGGQTVFRNGTPLPVNRSRLKAQFRGPRMTVGVHLKRGRAQAEVFTCDLTEEYIRINAKYS